MKNVKHILFVAALSVLAFSCKPDPIEVPKDPVAPVIESATLTGLNGEPKIKVGAQVKFTAQVSVINSSLDTYELEVRNGDELLASAGGVLKGEKADIEEVLNLDINPASLLSELTPTVYLKVTNTDEQYTEKTLPSNDVVVVCPPQLYDVLYILDNNGKVYEMQPMSERGTYRTYVDITEIGSSITVCENVENNTASGETWQFETPTSDYGIRWIGFNVFTGELFKMIDHTVTFDRTKMDKDCQTYDVYWGTTLVRDCEVQFLNYPDKMKLQSDRFANVEKNSARYTGHDGSKFEVYYMEDVNWLTIKGQWSDNTVIWVTGDNSCVPMEPFMEGHALNWFESNPACAYSAVAMVNTDGNNYSCLLYMTEKFGIKLFDYWAWANELAWTSITPETLVISPMEADPETGEVAGNFGNAGPNFSEGLWTLSYNTLTKEASLTKYLGTLAAPVEGVAYTPEPVVPDPVEPGTGELYVVDNNSNAFAMSNVSGSLYRVDNDLAAIGTSFVIAENFKDGAVDWSKKVYGMKDGKIDEISEGGEYIDVDPAYAVYNKKPWKINFDTATKELTYREGIWKNSLASYGDGTSVAWVKTLPKNCEVCFFDFTKKVSEIVNTAIFENIDDSACTAKFVGVSENFELWMVDAHEWLIFTTNISTNKYRLIGKNASFPQAPYTEYPIIESDFKNTQSLPLHKISDTIYRTDIYLADDFAIRPYSALGWAYPVNAWTSSTPDILVPHGDKDTYGTQNVEKSFTPGLYRVEYDSTANSLSLTKK